MALSRSASGPGGLSINTTSANSLFGSSTTPAAGGMFGTTQASKPGGLFGTTATTQPATGGLFGSTATTSQPATGGLFGAAQPQQSGGLFGATAATSQPATGGLFGAPAATSQPQTGGLFGAANTTGTGGLFGASTTQPQQTGGMFGGTNTTGGGGLFGGNTTQPAQSGGLFGGSTAQQPAQTGGLFGGSTAQPTQTNSLFGGLNTQTQNKPATSLFGGALGGNTQNQQQPQQQSSMFSNTQNQQQTVPGVTIDISNVRGTTRFNDLHESLQAQIQTIDTYIQDQIKYKNDIDAIIPSHSHQLSCVPNDVEFCRRKLIGVESAQASDAESITLAKRLIETDNTNAKLSFRTIDNLLLPPQYHTTNIWSSTKNPSSSTNPSTSISSPDQDIVGFFSKTADELANTLDKYQKHIQEIEQFLRGVEASCAAQINGLVAKRNGMGNGGQDDAVEMLTGALRDFEESLLGVAGKVGGAREGVQSLQLGRFGDDNGNRRGARGRGVY